MKLNEVSKELQYLSVILKLRAALDDKINSYDLSGKDSDPLREASLLTQALEFRNIIDSSGVLDELN